MIDIIVKLKCFNKNGFVVIMKNFQMPLLQMGVD